VYVRVVHKGAPRPDRSPDAFDTIGPYGAATETIVQYWFFYAARQGVVLVGQSERGVAQLMDRALV
jgi:hypothetical protein